MLEKTCLHSMTFLGRKPGSDICLHPAYIPSVAFSMPEKGDWGAEESKANMQMLPSHSLPPSLHFLKAAKA